MEAEIKITEVLLKQARVLRNSHDPAEAIAAAKWEIRFEEEIARLRKMKPQLAGGR
jgi:hypothetical protein